MRNTIILDENLSPKLAEQLYRQYNVILPKRGMDDEEILEMAVMLDCYVLTRDRGFPTYPKLIYLPRTSIHYIKERLRQCQE